MKKQKPQTYTIKQWSENINAQEKKRLYLESIPDQVSLSMAFEGEPVSIKMLKEYLKTMKNTL